MAVSPSRSLPPSSQRRTAHIPTISTAHQPPPAPSSSDLLQNRLRQLLICDSAEELRVDQVKIRAALNTQCRLTGRVQQMAPLSPPAEYSSQRCHKSLPDLHCRGSGGEPSSNKSSNKSLSNRDSGGSSGHYTQRSEPAPPPRQVSWCDWSILSCRVYLVSVSFALKTREGTADRPLNTAVVVRIIAVRRPIVELLDSPLILPLQCQLLKDKNV